MGVFCINEYYIYTLLAAVLLLGYYVLRLRTQISVIKERKEKLIKEAYFNPVTNLPNKKNIKYVLDEQIDRTLRHDRSFFVMAIKVNNYEAVYELSQELGNKYMYEASNVIIEHTRNEDLVAHINEDTFIILFNEYLEDGKYHVVIQRLQNGFAQKPNLDADISYDVAMGISKYPNDGTDSEVLIQKAISEAVSKQF